MDAPAPPVRAAALLRWMAEHGDRLRELADRQEREGHPTRMPADDGHVRAHLRYLAEALTATADAGLAQRLRGFAGALDAWFAQQAGELDAYRERAEAAIALEEHLQFGTRPGRDPSLDAALERRLRLMGWMRLFAHGLEAHLGASVDGVAEHAMAWMGARQQQLARMVLTIDAHARRAHVEANQGRPLDPVTLDEIAQTAAVRGVVRQLAEALEATLPATP